MNPCPAAAVESSADPPEGGATNDAHPVLADIVVAVPGREYKSCAGRFNAKHNVNARAQVQTPTITGLEILFIGETSRA